VGAAWVLMPKTAVDLDGGATARENNVGTPRQILAVQPETVAHPMKQPTDEQFGRSVLGLVGLHHPATRFWNVGPGSSRPFKDATHVHAGYFGPGAAKKGTSLSKTMFFFRNHPFDQRSSVD